MKRVLEAIRRWFRGWNHEPQHAGGDIEFIDLTQATISRKQTSGRPPWETETAPIRVICLIPMPDPNPLHPRVRERLGCSSTAEYVEDLFAPLERGLWARTDDFLNNLFGQPAAA